jgi:hypothetical protein
MEPPREQDRVLAMRGLTIYPYALSAVVVRTLYDFWTLPVRAGR